jgi:hypothetical protein
MSQMLISDGHFNVLQLAEVRDYEEQILNLTTKL